MVFETRLIGTGSRLAWMLAVVTVPAWAQRSPPEGSDIRANQASEQQPADQTAKGDSSGLSVRVTTGYPERALRNELTGTVGLTVTVTAEGRATNCVVTQSSGHAELDLAACKEIQEKARFDPALDAEGKPTSAQFSTKVTFKIN